MAAMACVSCGPPRVTLPSGTGQPLLDYEPIFGAATASCRDVRTLTADLSLSGSAGRQRLRGHVIAGFAPGALRLEGVAPFGGPVFILVAENGQGTLLLPRDRRVLQSAPPADILDALAGVALSPDDLLAALTGCVKAGATPIAARAYGTDWIVVDLKDGGRVYLHRAGAGWQLVAGLSGGLEIDYVSRLGGGLPQIVRIHSADQGQAPSVAVELRLQSFDTNAAIARGAFSVAVPPGTSPITLDELRRSGPLGH
jgi:hypothetical protein